MRWSLLFCLCLTGVLGAQAPLHITAVERRGSPPYESEDRIYRLDGGRNHGLHPGDRLTVRRTGEAKTLGHLRVVEVLGEQAEARFEPSGGGFPMKGDLAWREELVGIPGAPLLDGTPIPTVPTAKSLLEAPPREGILFFLPQQAELSPAGIKKVEGWVQAWGAGGRWTLQIPSAKGIKPALQKQRADALKAVLKSLGVDEAALETTPRMAEGKYDPAWIRRWD